jgi:xanthine dehydrogenase YagS FAD-binding subunit
MNPFQYISATTPDEAISYVGNNGRYLAGGIDLLGEMKDYIVSPDILVNVKGATEPGTLAPIRYALHSNTNQPICTISGTTLIAEIATNIDLKKVLPGICEAASEVGSPQIRDMATLGGNLLQHSRCWYYRQPDITCLKRGGTNCYGQEGENKYLSLFSGCACISPIVSNLATALMALDASVDIKRAGKRKTLSLSELYHKAWENPEAHNSLDPQDFLLSVTIPNTRTRSAYRQVSEKSEFDWALVSCAAAGNVNGIITKARVVLGAVAPVPYMVEEANQFLEGKPLTEDTVSKAADLILKDAKPLAQNGYKVPLAHTLIRRTLLALNA